MRNQTKLLLRFLICHLAIFTWQISRAAPLTLEEISKHDNEKSCWIIVDLKVYDITQYINKHPTEQSELIKWCGKESSQAYKTKGKLGRPHSPYADKELKKLLLGKIDELTPKTSNKKTETK